LVAIYALDNPYRPGLGNIRPVAMERTLALLDDARAAIGDDAPIPCDEEGTRR